MRAVLRTLVFGVFSLSLLITTPPPPKLQAADWDKWVAASNDGFGDSTVSSAKKLLDYGNQLFSSTNKEIYFTETLNFPDNQRSLQGALNATDIVVFPDASGKKYAYASRGGSGANVDYYDPDIYSTPLYWETARFPHPSCSGNGSNSAISAMTVWGDYLYVGTTNNTCGAQVWRLSKFRQPSDPDPNKWENVMMDGGTNKKYYSVQYFFVVEGKLIVSFMNTGISSCRLARSETGEKNSWEYYQASGLPGNITHCINSAVTIFGKTWVTGFISGRNGFNNSIYGTLDGANYFPVGPSCVLNGAGTNCSGPFLGAPSTLTSLADRQLLVGTALGGMYRVCPSDFDGNYMYYYPSLYPLADPQLNGYQANNILVYKDNIFVAEGKRPNTSREAKVWRIATSDLTAFVRSDMKNCGPKIPANLEISLPSSAIFTPKEIRFGADTFNFSATEPCFKIANECNSRFEVTRVGTGQIDQHYSIKVLNIERDTSAINLDDPQNPQGVAWGGKLTFKEPLPNSVISSIAATIRNAYPGQNLNTSHTFVGTDSCEVTSDPFEATKLCFKTTYTMTNPLERPGQPLTQHLFQSIEAPVSGIFVEGNVGGSGLIKDFRIQYNSLAVGGTVTVRGGTKTSNYLSGQTLLDWNKISPKLTTLLESGLDSATEVSALNGNIFNGANWNLNSSSSDPRSLSSTTFSSPPEGKLWRHNGNLIINAPLSFTGSGTVLIRGDLTISGAITCTDSRLGIIAEGSITLNTNSIDCGAYTALGGSISFGDASSGSGTVRGIFVAKNNINLPNLAQLTEPYFIKYDAHFASSPTALYRELLKIVFTTSS